MKKLIYISHAYGGKEENIKEIEKIIRTLYSYPSLLEEYCFVSPVHNYECLYADYDNENYYVGLEFCMDLLMYCDEMWVFCDYTGSKGVVGEIDRCHKHKIPIRYIKTLEDLVPFIEEKKYKESINLTPVANREIKRDIVLYTVVKIDNAINSSDKKLKDIVKKKILYENFNDAVAKLNKLTSEDKNTCYTIIEVELDRDGEIDLSSNKHLNMLRYFRDEFHEDNCTDSELLYSFIHTFKFTYIKRTIISNSKINENSIIPLSVKNIYKVYDTKAIKRITRFTSYNISDGNIIVDYPFRED